MTGIEKPIIAVALEEDVVAQMKKINGRWRFDLRKIMRPHFVCGEDVLDKFVLYTTMGVCLTDQQIFALYDALEKIEKTIYGNAECWIKKDVYVTTSLEIPGVDVRKFFYPESGKRTPTRKGIHLRTMAGWNELKTFVKTVVNRPEMNYFVRCEDSHDEVGVRCALCE